MENLGSSASGAFSLKFARLKFYWRFFGNMSTKKFASGVGVTLHKNGFISLVNSTTKSIDVYDTNGEWVYQGISGFYVFDNGYKLVVDGDKYGKLVDADGMILQSFDQVHCVGQHNAFVCQGNDCYKLYRVNQDIHAPFVLKVAKITGFAESKDGLIALHYAYSAELLDKNNQVIPFDHALEAFCFEKDGSITACDKNFRFFKVDVEHRKLIDATDKTMDEKATKTKTRCHSCHQCYMKDGQKFAEWPFGAYIRMMAEHYLTIDFDGKFIVLDVTMSKAEIFGALSSLVYEFGSVEGDISRQMFDYLVLLTKCLSGKEFSLKEAYKQYLLGCC